MAAVLVWELIFPADLQSEQHAYRRLRKWLCAKHKVQSSGTLRFPDDHLYCELGLVQLCAKTGNFPWATARVLSRNPDVGNPHVRFDERDVEMKHGKGH